MSWSKNVAGKRDAVAAAIEADQQTPQGIKDVIRAAVGSGESAVHVETYGHLDANGGDATIKIRLTQIVGAILLLILSSSLSAPALAQGTTAPKPAGVVLPQEGDDELLLLGSLQKNQALGVWEGALNVGMGRWTGPTTLAGVVTSFFSFGPATGVGAGAFVKQTFWQGATGRRIYGSAALTVNAGSASQIADGSGLVSLGLALKRANVTGYIEGYVQRPVALNGAAGPSQSGGLDQAGINFGAGFGHPVVAAH